MLVTGVGGFIAPHVARLLRNNGHDVVGVDIKPLTDSDFEVAAADLLSGEPLSDLLHDVDAICHLAGVGDVYLATADPALAARLNVEATANLVTRAAAAGVSKVVFASTWEVYGHPRYQPIDELHPCEPDHPYSITKLAAERIGRAIADSTAIQFVALRLGTAYGTGMRSNSVFSAFIERARRKQPLVINGPGHQFRQFTHVSDTARAFLLSCESDIGSDTLNIVAEERTSIVELAELVQRRFGADIVHEASRTGDVAPALVSSERAGELLGWRPTVTFDEGLEELMDSYVRVH